MPATAVAPVAPAAQTSAVRAAPTAAQPAKVYEYGATLITDNSGPGAQNAKGVHPGRKAILAWWNDTRGKALGIKINGKFYDGRYDSSVIASLWPGALANDKPVFASGFGGDAAAPLGQRLPTDKVPLFLGGGGNGFAWLPNQWHFNGQTTYAHQTAGFVAWKLASWKENRPLRIAQVGAEVVTLKDAIDGFRNAMDKGLFAGKATYLGAEWVALTATDASNEMKRLIDKQPDYIETLVSITPVVAMLRALEQYKAQNIKIVLHSSGGIGPVAADSSMKDLEGHFEVSSEASDVDVDVDVEAYKVYQQYKDSDAKAWSSQTSYGMMSVLPALLAIERVAKAAGPDKITGEAIYNSMFTGPFTSKDPVGLVSRPHLCQGRAVPNHQHKSAHHHCEGRQAGVGFSGLDLYPRCSKVVGTGA